MLVVTPREMRRLEFEAFEKHGCTASSFMDRAGEELAAFIGKTFPGTKVCALIGKGNNGGDGLSACISLLGLGFTVAAYPVFSLQECSPLSQERWVRFLALGGAITTSFEGFDLLLDALLGTGCSGSVEGRLAEVIVQANDSDLPIVAIDIPSGLNGETGEVATVAIKAAHTLTLEFSKLGFFLREGWNHVGKITVLPFGLPSMRVEASGIIPEEVVLPGVRRTRHKYETGYVLGVAGSRSMPGSATLATRAAFRAGAGIVRLFHKKMETSSLDPEVIRERISVRRLKKEAKRAKALFIGCGLGRGFKAWWLMRRVLPKLHIPLVIDGDALHYLEGLSLPQNTLLTPHRGEMKAVLRGSEPTLCSCQAFVEKRGVTLVLKGAPTLIFQKGELPAIIPRGSPAMAKAGSGDVLTGILAALLAQGLPPREAAITGVWLHAVSGEVAEEKRTAWGCMASDLIENLFNEED